MFIGKFSRKKNSISIKLYYKLIFPRISYLYSRVIKSSNESILANKPLDNICDARYFENKLVSIKCNEK